MSTYTTQLRWPIEQYLVTQGIDFLQMSVRERCVKAIPYIFNFSFPMWKETDRQKFETDFLMYFYMQEIGAETLELWKMQLENWLNVNMPYFNLKMNAILYANDFQEVFTVPDEWSETYTGERTDAGNSSSVANGENNSMQKYYEVPLRNVTSIESHLNNATQVEATGKTTTTGEDSSQMNDSHTIKRTMGHGLNKVEILSQILGLTMNVEKEIFDAMSVLFMGIY